MRSPSLPSSSVLTFTSAWMVIFDHHDHAEPSSFLRGAGVFPKDTRPSGSRQR